MCSTCLGFRLASPTGGIAWASFITHHFLATHRIHQVWRLLGILVSIPYGCDQWLGFSVTHLHLHIHCGVWIKTDLAGDPCWYLFESEQEVGEGSVFNIVCRLYKDCLQPHHATLSKWQTVCEWLPRGDRLLFPPSTAVITHHQFLWECSSS